MVFLQRINIAPAAIVVRSPIEISVRRLRPVNTSKSLIQPPPTFLGSNCGKKNVFFARILLSKSQAPASRKRMGQIRDTPEPCTSPAAKRVNRNSMRPTSPSKKSNGTPRKPDVKISYDGFWTTQRPAAGPFSKEWFQTQFSVMPYWWAMIKLAMSVSKSCVAIVAFGTLGRALIDAAKLYANGRFVHEVSQPIF